MVKDLFGIKLGERGGRNPARQNLSLIPPFTPEAAEKYAFAARKQATIALSHAEKQQTEIGRLTKELASANAKARGRGADGSFAAALDAGEILFYKNEMEAMAERLRVLDDDNDALRAASQLCQARANDLHSILNPLLASLEAETLASTEIGNIVIDFNNSTNCHEQRQFAHNEAHGRVQVYLD